MGSKHEHIWREFSADLMEEVLLKGNPVEGQPHIFCVPENTKIIVTDMCKTAVIQHLLVPDTNLESYPRTMEFLGLDAEFKDEWETLVSAKTLGCTFKWCALLLILSSSLLDH